MIYLTGSTNDRDEPFLVAHGIGLVCGQSNSYHLRIDRYPWWGADLGMGFCEAMPYLDWLDARPRERCLYAVSPDAYPDPLESMRRGLEYAPIIRDMGFPAAIVAQDGAERLHWPWDELDVLFVGGERRSNSRDEWKIGQDAERLVHQARDQGKWVHMGRVNSMWRMERAREMGCNSADGTFVKYRRRQRAGEDDTLRDLRGAAEIEQWTAWLAANPILFSFEAPEMAVHRAASGLGHNWDFVAELEGGERADG